MSELIERMAQALCAVDGLVWDDQADPQTNGNGGDNNQIAYRDAARAALGTALEPTEAMLAAVEAEAGRIMRATCGILPGSPLDFIDGAEVRATFTAYWKAALQAELL